MGTYSAETLQIDEKWKDIIHEERENRKVKFNRICVDG